MAAHQDPPSLGFSRQEHWSGLPLPSPMHESEKWKGSRSFVSDSSRPHGLEPTRLLCPWDFPGKSTGVGRHHLLQLTSTYPLKLSSRVIFYRKLSLSPRNNLPVLFLCFQSTICQSGHQKVVEEQGPWRLGQPLFLWYYLSLGQCLTIVLGAITCAQKMFYKHSHELPLRQFALGMTCIFWSFFLSVSKASTVQGIFLHIPASSCSPWKKSYFTS